MESGAASRAEGQTGPPVLPVKQRRNQYSRSSSSSVDLESYAGLCSPLEPQEQNFTDTDVFSEATDCYATQCPIHQRYDTSHRHQERFFSDSTPPPVPKKRIARTLSLPGVYISPPSPLSPMSPLFPLPLHNHPYNFDNPLYMLAPIVDTHPQGEQEEVEPVKKTLVPSLSMSQLSFDTPDEHLPCLFSSITDQGVVSQGIQHRHLLFLRSIAQNVDAEILLQGQDDGKLVGLYRPQDFLLCEGGGPIQIGDALYYKLHSPKFPGKVLGARVHRWTDSAPLADSTPQPSHVNLQGVIVLFPPDSSPKNETSPSQIQDPTVVSLPSQSACTAVKPSSGGNTKAGKSQSDFMNANFPSVLSLLQRGYSVSVERDLPQVTLQDFIQDRWSRPTSEALLYERRLCILFLQLMKGFQHLCNSRAAGFELRPQDIFLVWPTGERREIEVITTIKDKDASDKEETWNGMKMSKTEKSNKAKEEIEQKEWETEGVQMLWRTWGSPRVVLAHQPLHQSVSHTLSSIHTRIGALLQYCLHPPGSNPSPSQHLTSNCFDSRYKRGLLNLAAWLQDETSGLQMAETVAFLQALLWGPRTQLFKLDHIGSKTNIVNNWLSIKRALLVMKLAETGLVQDQHVPDWEDCLCLQYLSFCECQRVIWATERLCIALNDG